MSWQNRAGRALNSLAVEHGRVQVQPYEGEPDDEGLWDRLRSDRTHFILGQWWHQTPEEARPEWPQTVIAWFDHYLRGAPQSLLGVHLIVNVVTKSVPLDDPSVLIPHRVSPARHPARRRARSSGRRVPTSQYGAPWVRSITSMYTARLR